VPYLALIVWVQDKRNWPRIIDFRGGVIYRTISGTPCTIVTIQHTGKMFCDSYPRTSLADWWHAVPSYTGCPQTHVTSLKGYISGMPRVAKITPVPYWSCSEVHFEKVHYLNFLMTPCTFPEMRVWRQVASCCRRKKVASRDLTETLGMRPTLYYSTSVMRPFLCVTDKYLGKQARLFSCSNILDLAE
jgi:hypothetical protein